MGLNLKILKMNPSLYAWRYIWKALRTRLIISSMFLFAKTLCTGMTLWHYDVRKYIADAILFREIQCKKMDNLTFYQCFQCKLGWNKVKYARITITHVCFIALTLVVSLGWCWTLCLWASCSKSILGTRQKLMHEKTCVIPTLEWVFPYQRHAILMMFYCAILFANWGFFFKSILNHRFRL